MKKFYFLFLLTLLPLVASAAGQVEIDGIWYFLNSSSDTKTASVASNPNGNYSGFIDIPESVTYGGVTYSVTSIAYSAFSGCSGLTSVTIPNSVTSIDWAAFKGCSGLTSVTIPNSVNSISRNAFEGTAWYDNQPDGLVYAGSCVYKYKGEMSKNTTISLIEGTTGIADGAFYGCYGLTSITIPNSVISIGGLAFCSCSSLTSVIIPISVTSIGSQVFDGCSALTSIKVESGNMKYDSRDNCNAIIETSSNTLIVGSANTIIPNSVTSIGYGAFVGRTSLTSITFPNSVMEIQYEAFAGCTGLTSIELPSSIKRIDGRAFSYCSITTVTIPSSVTDIAKKTEKVHFKVVMI